MGPCNASGVPLWARDRRAPARDRGRTCTYTEKNGSQSWLASCRSPGAAGASSSAVGGRLGEPILVAERAAELVLHRLDHGDVADVVLGEQLVAVIGADLVPLHAA